MRPSPRGPDGKDPARLPDSPCIRRDHRRLPEDSLQTQGVRHLHAGHDSLENAVMFPTVAEVVLVHEHFPLIVEKFAQAPPPFVSHLRGVVGIGNPVLLLSESEEGGDGSFPTPCPPGSLDGGLGGRSRRGPGSAARSAVRSPLIRCGARIPPAPWWGHSRSCLLR
jgi:hypothetical protein